jgi:hypothetical protein
MPASLIKVEPRLVDEGGLFQLNIRAEEYGGAEDPSESSEPGFAAAALDSAQNPLYGTWKGALLENVPPGVTTWTVPVVAPVGTVVVISELETTSKTAPVPSKLTLVAPVRLVPRILTVVPAEPEAGSVSTNGPKPTDRLKTAPK